MADRKRCLRVSAKKEEALNLCLFGSAAINSYENVFSFMNHFSFSSAR